MQQPCRLLIFLIQPYMFRANSPILRSTRLYVTAFGTMHRHCCRPVHRSATVSVHCTKRCIYIYFYMLLTVHF